MRWSRDTSTFRVSGKKLLIGTGLYSLMYISVIIEVVMHSHS